MLLMDAIAGWVDGGIIAHTQPRKILLEVAVNTTGLILHTGKDSRSYIIGL